MNAAEKRVAFLRAARILVLWRMASRVLVIEDDATLAGSLVRRLRRDGYEVELSPRGDSGLERAVEWQPDLVVLDLMLPGKSGLEVLERLARERLKAIVLTARVEISDRVRCFELGAIDYVPKPFFLDEISARVRARLAPLPEFDRKVVRFGDAAVDLGARIVTLAGAPIALTRFEFAVLAYLVERPGRAVSRSQIQEQALPGTEQAMERTVDTHIVRLRRKLGSSGGAIVTVWGVGYRFDVERP
jgi:two-component system, OmpR family, response regulator